MKIFKVINNNIVITFDKNNQEITLDGQRVRLQTTTRKYYR